MDDKRSAVDRLGAIEGADAAALGMDAPPESAPPGAVVDDSEEELVPGAGLGAVHPDESKPWFTSLAATSDQAGVANDPPDAQEPQFPTEDEPRA